MQASVRTDIVRRHSRAAALSTDGRMNTPSLAGFFLDSVAVHPDRSALWADGETLSYRALFGRAAAVAATLNRAMPGGEPEVGPANGCFVALFARRSADAYAGLLGVLFAGRAYLPLSPKFPAERNAYMMEHAGATVLVVDAGCLEDARKLVCGFPSPLTIVLPGLPSTAWGEARPQDRLIGRDELAAPLTLEDARATARGRQPDDFAYLLFTSGSTGQPKGVAVTHSNVTTYIRSVIARYAPVPEDRFTQLFELTFDPSVQDMFTCWGSGACLYCVPDRTVMAPDGFVVEHGLTVWYSVPAIAGMMNQLGRLKPGRLSSLRWMLFCGEALPTSLLPALRAAAPGAVLENLYGPTEATIIATIWRDEPTLSPVEMPAAPIGHPVPGMSALILGEDGNPAEEGELVVGGPQITPGYWLAPGLTAERFFEANGIRWYRTGDRVRHDPAHGFLYYGRMDQQVKLRGFRVELGEIEKAVREAAGTDLVAVVPWRRGVGNTAGGVVAYVSGARESVEAIRRLCEERLPDYMVPREIRQLTEMPLSASGKIDRRLLEERGLEQD